MLLLGNEAIVRGALEAGVGFVSCYPGTPSSEVPDTFFRISPEGAFIFEYSTNEKVAMEVAGGAALAGVPSLVTMKHVGVNVAADPMMTLAYVGTPGGMVILSADDPGCHSSQNEQDNRYYARLAGIPCLEPATAQECKDMTREALTLSAKYEQPIMIRTTTRVNHLRGPVNFGRLPAAKTKGHMSKDPMRFVPVPAVSRVRHKVLLENLGKFAAEAETSPWNTQRGKGRTGVIASGISRAYANDVIAEHNLDDALRVLELGMTYPLPNELLVNFLKKLDTVIILEELEPLVEQHVRALIQKHHLAVEVLGKGQHLPLEGEYSTLMVRNILLRTLNQPLPQHTPCEVPQQLPMRPPNLCAGCSHRSTYFAVRKVFGDQALYSSDIGCYTLGILPPLKAADFLLCMGSSISTGCGTAKVADQPVVAFIGDSTFFHSGMTGLVNAVYNNHNILIVILDNRTTAMTGHQPNPGVDKTQLGDNAHKIDIEAIVRGCGVEHVTTVKALNQKALVKTLEEYKSLPGVRVIISRDPCEIFKRKVLRSPSSQVAYVEEGFESSEDVLACLNELGCPAFFLDKGKMGIDPFQCSGCMLCVQLSDHIKARKRSLA
jgi:indolepyruvate ferredoxin oxidoreductase alpha subunit